ncbi:MAG: phage holin family protein [Candidatus Eremiobacteraeota bacterium]|nr:phage holin family protein [Candidatus Eremiobacteraeota bacterium]
MRNAPAEADRSIPELLQKLAAETSLLIRQELALARAEIMGTLRKAERPAIAFGVAALFALGAFGALTALLIAAIAVAVPVWAAALIVTVLYVAIAVAAVVSGRTALKQMGSPLPKQTIKTVKDDVATVQAGVRRGGMS